MSSKKNEPLFYDWSFEFLNRYIPGQGMSKATQKCYQDSLASFRQFLNCRSISIGKFLFSNCTRDLVLSFMEWLRDEKKLKSSSIATRLAALKSYVKYAAEKNVSLAQIALKVESVKPFKVETKVRPVLSAEQVEKLACSTENNLKGYRNKTIVLLLYESACRVSELTTLKVFNVFCDENEPYIVVDGKGKKQRAIPITNEMGVCLKNYIHLFHNDDSPKSDFLFYTVIKGEVHTLSPRRIQTMLNEIAAKVRETDSTFPERIYPHMFRRSRATQLYRNGMALEVVSAVLGHNQLETTRVYAIPSTSMMRKAIETGLMNGKDEEPDWQTKEDLLARYFGI